MVPSADGIEGYRNNYMRSGSFTETEFESFYRKHLGAARVVIESAKIYAAMHWQEVKDWSGLDVTVYDNKKTKTHYYSYKERKPITRVSKKSIPRADGKKPITDVIKSESKHFDRLLAELERKEKAGHNPVLGVVDVCLDPSDGDFSIRIKSNKYPAKGHYHLWINGEAIVTIAQYIESQIGKIENAITPKKLHTKTEILEMFKQFHVDHPLQRGIQYMEEDYKKWFDEWADKTIK